MSRKARHYDEAEFADLLVGTMMLQWDEDKEEMLAGWTRREGGWHNPDVLGYLYSNHMIWSPTSLYEVIYDPRVG